MEQIYFWIKFWIKLLAIECEFAIDPCTHVMQTGMQMPKPIKYIYNKSGGNVGDVLKLK
jgi:hypothetical protein